MSDVETKLFDIFLANSYEIYQKTFPEIKSCLYRNYEDCLTDSKDKCLDDLPKLKRFLELIGDYEKMIADKNLEFFDLEVEFLEEFFFQEIMGKEY